MDELAQTGLVDRDSALREPLDLTLDLVDAYDVVTALSQAGSLHQADISRSDDRNLHGRGSLLCSGRLCSGASRRSSSRPHPSVAGKGHPAMLTVPATRRAPRDSHIEPAQSLQARSTGAEPSWRTRLSDFPCRGNRL